MSEYQWKDVSVVGFDELMEALERADRKGYIPDAVKEAWEGFNWKPAQQQEMVALREVGLTRDFNGVCIVTVNGREAIRDSGDIISHFATLDWFASGMLDKKPERDIDSMEVRLYNRGWNNAIAALYTSPPAKKPWVGLTKEEVKHQWEIWRASVPRYAGFATGIEVKLKEKNNG